MEKTKVMAKFCVISDNLHPEIITQKLSIKPTKSWNKGDENQNRNVPKKETYWEIGTGYQESFDINNQLNTIIGIIKNKLDNLIELKDIYTVEYLFMIVINIENNETPAMYLNRETIEFANEIKSEIHFDLYIC